MFSYLILIGLCMCLFHKTAGLYEDQVGLYDWHQQYVGPMSYVSIDETTSTNRGVVVASETGILALIDSHSGELVWRRVFAPGINGHIDAVLRTKGGTLLSVSKSGKLIRSWDMNDGILKWETLTNVTAAIHNRAFPLSKTWRPGAVQATLTGTKQSLVAVAIGQDLSVHSAKTGELKWSLSLEQPEETVLCSVTGEEAAVLTLTAMDHSKLIISMFAASTGELKSTRELLAPWFSPNTTSCLLTKTHIVCLEATRLDLYYAPLLTDTPFQLSMLSSLLDIVAGDNQVHQLIAADTADNVWVEIDSVWWLLSLKDPQASVVRRGSEVGAIVDGMAVGSSGQSLLVGEREVKLKENRGKPVMGAIQFSKGGDKYQLVLIMEDHSIIFIDQEGVSWSREDALGALGAVEMLDLPAGQSEQIESFLELTKSESSPLKVAVLRAQLQFSLAKEFLMNLNKEVASLLQYDGTTLVRDQFNTHKLIVAATPNGKVYGLDSRNGDVLWQLFVSSFSSFQNGRPLLHILRTTSHPPHPPLAILIGRSKVPQCMTMLYEFNPLTGEALSPEPLCLPFQVVQALLLPTLDHTHSKILVMMTSEHAVITYPSSSEITETLRTQEEQLFLFVAEQGGSNITGYRVLLKEGGSPSPNNDYSGQLFSTEQFWQVQFPADSERILTVHTKKANERVSSLGDVLADRSVQYKYLNPNLVAVVTESTNTSKGLVTVYLIDSVTGGIVYHTSHKNALGPVHLTHSENWIVYQFLNTKQRRHELVVLELYETHSNQSHTVWSSLSPPPAPIVMSQAYAFPSALHSLSNTQTLRGITYKGIIFGLHSGRVALMPKSLLNPRRELELTDQMKEDGIPPYNPEIGFSPQSFINYNRTIARIQDIYAVPSGLESTCLLLVCGLDLYYTRVTPSKQFDLLADDFDYTLIGAVVVGMLVATIVLSRLSASKTLKLLWK